MRLDNERLGQTVSRLRIGEPPERFIVSLLFVEPS
jgi:hypothetical protein